MMVGMMVCAVVVVCAAQDHNFDSRECVLIPDHLRGCQ
jgi:hypothetical protein